MARLPLLARARLGLRRCWRAASGWRVYLLAGIMALPDVLDALPGVDLAPLLPEWLPGTKVAAFLAVARLAARAYATKLTAMPSRELPR
ncbi:hypothetical protein MPPM_5203 [Methylorubrum populi]|uniref:Uncharacterized protein n=1 Tax=Methylorubrum populi TaxID=223967 RepID=A0A169RIL7_9HYPH|nr:hypothetical protein [Methylorubrum populi]BAU93808.1 hypothetical protein MPPM_5203 [Methylorubrum populi]